MIFNVATQEQVNELNKKLSKVTLLDEPIVLTAGGVTLLNNINEYEHLEIYFECNGYSDVKVISTKKLNYAYLISIFASTSNYISATLSIYNGQLSGKYLTSVGFSTMTIAKIIGVYN